MYFIMGMMESTESVINSNMRAVGDIRGWDRETNTYTIYFDDDSLMPCIVKPQNIEVSQALEKK